MDRASTATSTNTGGHFQTDTKLVDTTATKWVDTSHNETMTVTDTYEYSEFVRNDVSDVYVTDGHWSVQQVLEYEDQPAWIDTSHSED
jgi:hypothetical protein